MADLELATKGDLQNLESKVVDRMDTLETRMQDRMEALETRMQDRMEASETRMLERMERIETSLLSAFQVWAVPVNGRIRKLELGDANLGERLAAIEDRLMNLERRQFPGSNPGSTH